METWLFVEAKKGPWAKTFGKHCYRGTRHAPLFQARAKCFALTQLRASGYSGLKTFREATSQRLAPVPAWEIRTFLPFGSDWQTRAPKSTSQTSLKLPTKRLGNSKTGSSIFFFFHDFSNMYSDFSFLLYNFDYRWMAARVLTMFQRLGAQCSCHHLRDLLGRG